MAGSKKKVLVVWGTRPEAIKMAPVVLALRREKRLLTRTCVTAQHRQLLDQALKVLAIRPDRDLDLMRPDQTLDALTARVLDGMRPVLLAEKPDLVLVQGDTTTAFAVAAAAHFLKIPVGHVEAGLRTHDFDQPFPEEMNRVLVSDLATLHFAPTPLAKKNLLKEGIPAKNIFVTGNTIVDALRLLPRQTSGGARGRASNRLILLTAHRRESFGKPMENIFHAVLDLVKKHPDIEVLYPVHPNPNVKGPAYRILRHPRVRLTAPIPYTELLEAMRASTLILTDSGGIQEEAPSFGKPVVVLREVTERPEAAMAGASFIAGTGRKAIVAAADRILNDPRLYRRMAAVPNPFGDGRAASRIAKVIARFFA